MSAGAAAAAAAKRRQNDEEEIEVTGHWVSPEAVTHDRSQAVKALARVYGLDSRENPNA